jgi:hypothetical protein
MLLAAVTPAAKALARSAFRRTRLGNVLRSFTYYFLPWTPREALNYCSVMQLERFLIRSPRPGRFQPHFVCKAGTLSDHHQPVVTTNAWGI